MVFGDENMAAAVIDRYHPFAQSFTEDLALIHAGEETLWWDETGTPAPWPQDFLDPAAGWTDEHDHHELEQQEMTTTMDTSAPF